MSTVPKWQPGTLYIKGALVQPLTAIAATAASLTNANFDSGDTGWTKDAVWTIVTGETFTGSYSAKFSGSPSAQGVIVNDDRIAITPGETVGASCMVNQGASSANDAGAVVRVYWYDAGGSAITPAYTEGTYVKSGSNGEWKRSSVTAVAPAGAAKFSLGARAYHDGSGQDLWVDSFTLDYTPRSAPEGLIYRAVQDDPGTSDSTEPTWPTTLGVQVVDNTVTWEAVYATRVTWEASPIMESGATEPDWPTTPGAMIVDGTVLWECFTRRVEDENCPNSKVVAIAASKVYAADDDIIRYSATINPLDWTSENDAGYLPYGLQTYGANPVAAMGLYRGNLVAFNTEGCQIWQVDEDPALSTLLDALPLGSSRHRALAPVNNDLFFLSSLGVRSISIAGGSTNLAAGDVGMPVDSLVVAAVEAMARALPLATYYPGAGQYWLAVAQEPLHDIAITGDLPNGYVGETGTYRYQVLGGLAPVTVEVTAGALPDGATIDTDGVVTFDYTTAGTFSWTLTATGADGNSDTLDDSVEITALACGVADSYTGGESFPTEFTVLLGADTGTVELRLITGDIPDKVEVWLGGVKVLDTGYIGDTSQQAALDAELASRSLPPETITQRVSTSDDLEAGWAIGDWDEFSFTKSTADVAATVKVYGPMAGTGWKLALSCPGGFPA